MWKELFHVSEPGHHEQLQQEWMMELRKGVENMKEEKENENNHQNENE